MVSNTLLNGSNDTSNFDDVENHKISSEKLLGLQDNFSKVKSLISIALHCEDFIALPALIIQDFISVISDYVK